MMKCFKDSDARLQHNQSDNQDVLSMCAYVWHIVHRSRKDICGRHIAFQWRHNERDGISNHRRLDYLLNRLFRHRSKKTSKLRVTDICYRESAGDRSIPLTQKASNAENVSIC